MSVLSTLKFITFVKISFITAVYGTLEGECDCTVWSVLISAVCCLDSIIITIAVEYTCTYEPRHKKPLFGVCDQVRLKPACSATETSQGVEILDIASIDIILSKQQTTRVLFRLRRCAGWSAPLLFAYGKNRFPHDVAHTVMILSFLTHKSGQKV